jgi:transcriptional regulator with XRE-family HTH domain
MLNSISGISQNIARIRKERGFTLENLAAALHTTRQNYFRLEKRGEKLTLEQLNAIADALDVELCDLLYSDRQRQSMGDMATYALELGHKNKELELQVEFLRSRHSFMTKALIQTVVLSDWAIHQAEELRSYIIQDDDENPLVFLITSKDTDGFMKYLSRRFSDLGFQDPSPSRLHSDLESFFANQDIEIRVSLAPKFFLSLAYIARSVLKPVLVHN